jgi:hypothetical protein
MRRCAGLAALVLAVSAVAWGYAQDVPPGGRPSQIHFTPIDLKKATQAYYASRYIAGKKPFGLLSALPSLPLPRWPFSSSSAAPKSATLGGTPIKTH